MCERFASKPATLRLPNNALHTQCLRIVLTVIVQFISVQHRMTSDPNITGTTHFNLLCIVGLLVKADT